MSGASIEQTLDLWSAELGAVKAQLESLFGHASVAASAAAFLDGLLGPERRKTGWMRAEAAGDPGPWRQQAVLGRSRWDADALRDLVRDYALETLAAPDAVLVIDETGFLKQGTSSCGVQRQYTGSAGKITNCQIGVFAAYVSDKGHAFIDRRLYLPKSWTDAPARLAAAHVPATVRFATKPRLAVGMIERALEAGVPFAWVAADSIYGVGEVEKVLRQAGKGYVLGVTGTHPFRSWGKKPGWSGTAETIAAGVAACSLRSSLGRRRHQGSAAVRLGLPGAGGPGGGGRGLRRQPRGVDAWPADPAQPGRPEPGVLHHLVPDRAPRSRCWSGSRAAAGRSRTASRPPRMSSASITTRRAAGTAGTATSRW